MTVTWCDWHHSEVSAPELYQLLSLHSAVFVLKQQCLYADMDGRDMEGDNRHIAGFDEAGLVACVRLLVQRDAVSIRRVVIAPRAQSGSGGAVNVSCVGVVRRALAGETHYPLRQAYLQAFYRGLSFAAVRSLYDEDGIPHIGMRRPPSFTLKD